MYALLSDKTVDTYEEAFYMIRTLDEGIAPTMIHCDFELATINAIRKVFPEATVAGCFFHLVRNLEKTIISSGLTTAYDEDPRYTCGPVSH